MPSADGAGKQCYSARNPCPVCGQGTKGCSRQPSGIHFCRGASAEKGRVVNGFACLGVDPTGEFYQFRLHEERAGRGPPRAARPSREPAPPPATADWGQRHARARRRMTSARLDALAG